MASAGDELLALLTGLAGAGVEFVVVGGAAAALAGSPIVTYDLDIVHQQSPENVQRLLAWLLAHGAYHRLDPANRRLPPTREQLLGHGHINLQTDLGKLDVLCELGPGERYEQLLPFAAVLEVAELEIRVLDLAKVIETKRRAGRPKDRAVLPVLLATLDERRKG